MTTEKRNIKLKHLITCMKCETSGKACDENCPTQYEAGNMGEIIENLEAISGILEHGRAEVSKMTREEINILQDIVDIYEKEDMYPLLKDKQVRTIKKAIKELEQVPCEMTVDEYRNRLMDAFYNADCGELIAVVVRPEESEFKHLEWLLKNHYHNQKQQSCEDCISRQAAKLKVARVTWNDGDSCYDFHDKCVDCLDDLPSVTPKEKIGHWVLSDVEGNRVWHCNCSECGKDPQDYIGGSENWWLIKNKLPKYCPNCGTKMQEVSE